MFDFYHCREAKSFMVMKNGTYKYVEKKWELGTSTNTTNLINYDFKI